MPESTEPSPSDTSTESEPSRHADILDLAKERFHLAYDALKDDFEQCEKVQDFIAGEHWPQAIRKERDLLGRPCLTLDHTTQYLRHVINTGLLRYRDIRILAMSGDADEDVADIIAGIVRQISQTSTAKVAYETGLRHAASNGFGYWRVVVQAVPGTPFKEIAIHKIREPRMVMFDPFALYPDGRDAKFVFVFTKLTKKEFDRQYPDRTDAQSWHQMHEESVLPWTGNDSMVLAEYYYQTDDGLFFAILTPNYVLEDGKHHGDAIPIIRVVGEEYEVRGKERKRGMINESSMDAARAYDYSASSFIENVALAPLAPWIAAASQIEDYLTEWDQAHRIPRAALRYKPITVGGQVLPPPQRSMPAGIPEGWQGMMENLTNSQQMIMGLSQPNMLGTGGIPVQSGAGIEAQQEPGDVNTMHFIEHWHLAIEQTGRVILSMIPHVYSEPQVVKIVADDGSLDTAVLNPRQAEAVLKQMGQDARGLQKVLSTSYNPLIGRYDAAVSTGPPTATKRSAAARGMLALVQADTTLMQKAGDLVVKNMDIPGSDVLAKRLKAFLPPGVSDEDDAQLLQQLQQLAQENQSLNAALKDAQQIILGEREKAQADLQQAMLKADADLAKAEQHAQNALIEQNLADQRDLKLADLKAQVELETNIRDNIVKILLEKMRAENKLDLAGLQHLLKLSAIPDYGERMTGYAGVLDGLHQNTSAESDTADLTPLT